MRSIFFITRRDVKYAEKNRNQNEKEAPFAIKSTSTVIIVSLEMNFDNYGSFHLIVLFLFI